MYMFVAFLLSTITCYTLAYPSGAPIETCKTFSANHTGYAPQNSQSKYEILLSRSSVTSKDSVSVTLQGVGEKFKGFFIQGQDERGRPIGKFTPLKDAQTRDCKPGTANAATHTNSNDKSKIALLWQAPATYKGKVVFRAVVLKSYEVFWNNLVSSPLTVM